MKLREISILAALTALVAIRLLQNPLCATVIYIALSAFLQFDSDVTPERNFHGEVEEGKFVHKFTKLTKTFSGLPVNITYHSVECGKGEPIVFFHGA
jgi:hypothetical protein